MTRLVTLTTTAGGELHAAPERITAVWQIATYTPAVNESAFPGKVTVPSPAQSGFQTRVEIAGGAGTFSVTQSPADVVAAREAALRRGKPGRVFRRVRTVFAKEAA